MAQAPTQGRDGRRRRLIRLDTPRWDTLDFGNYRPRAGAPFTLAALLAAAREVGDDEAADALERTLEHRNAFEERHGARRLAGVSTWANAFYGFARHVRPGLTRDLVHGDAATSASGPVFAEAAYPAVLVAKAVTDGTSLEFVLRPRDRSGRTTLGVERLRPDDRLEVTLTPASGA